MRDKLRRVKRVERVCPCRGRSRIDIFSQKCSSSFLKMFEFFSFWRLSGRVFQRLMAEAGKKDFSRFDDLLRLRTSCKGFRICRADKPPQAFYLWELKKLSFTGLYTLHRAHLKSTRLTTTHMLVKRGKGRVWKGLRIHKFSFKKSLSFLQDSL